MAKDVNIKLNVNVGRAVNNIDAVKKAIDDLNHSKEKHTETTEKAVKSTKDLTKEEKKLFDAAEKLKESRSDNFAELQRLKIEQQKQTKQVKDQVKEELGLVNAYTKESKKLRELKNLYKGMILEEGKATAQTEALRMEIEKLDSKLKDVDASTGDFYRNVGDYPKTDKLGDIADGLDGLGGAAGAATGVVQGLASQLMAFVSNPYVAIIGAIAIGLRAVYKAFTSTEEGGNKMAQLFAVLRGAIQPVIDVLADLGETLFSFIDDNIDDIIYFGSIITQSLLAPLKVVFSILGGIGKALYRLVTGDFKGAWEALEEGADGVAEAFTDINDAIEDTENATAKSMKAALALEKAKQALIKREREFSVENAKQLTQIEKLKNIRDDETRSITQRIKANEDLRKVEQKRSKEAEAIAMQRLKNAKEEAKQKGKTPDLLQAIAEAEIELAEAQNDSYGILAEYISNNNSLLRDSAAIKRIDIDLTNELADLEAELESQKLENKKKALEEAFKITVKSYNENTEQYKSMVAEMTLLDAQIKKAKEDEVEEAAERNRDIREDEIDHQKDLLLITVDKAEDIYQIELQALLDKIALYKDDEDAYRELLQEKEILTAKYNQKNKEEEKKKTDDTANQTKTRWQLFNEQLAKMTEKYNEFMENNEHKIDAATSTAIQSLDLTNEIMSVITQKQLDNIEQTYTIQQSELTAQLNQGLISQAEFDAKSKQLEQQKQRESIAIERKAFKRQKANDIAMAGINTAVAVTKALGSAPPPVNFVLAGANAIAGGIQIGLISARKFKAASGGIVPGAPSSFDSVPATLAPGETVINSNSSSMFPGLLNMVNQAGGGKSLVPTNVTSQGSSGTNGSQQPLKAYVVETEVTRSQRDVERIKQNTEF